MRSSELLLAALLALPAGAGAEHLGTIGPAHAIAEPDLLEAIHERLHELARSGELARLQQAAQARVLAAAEAPAPVPGLRRTTRPRSFRFDPTAEIPQAITGAAGRILVPAGTRVNPLAHATLRGALLFFDARDPAQLRHARAVLAREGSRTRFILTGGSPLALMRQWQRPVYFDQHGVLTTRLGIRQVPARVVQDGLALRIDEVR